MFLAAISSLALAGVRPVRASEPWTIGLWQSHALTDRGGRTPETAAIETLEKAFDRADITVDIDAGHDPVVLPGEDPTCSTPAKDHWFDTRDHADNRVNLCLTDGTGGCARVGDRVSIAGGRHLVDPDDHAFVTPDTPTAYDRFVVLHEVAHNAGYRHTTPTGFVREAGGRVHVSPATTWAVDATDPVCDTDHPDIDRDRVMYHLYYSPCTAGLFKTNR